MSMFIEMSLGVIAGACVVLALQHVFRRKKEPEEWWGCFRKDHIRFAPARGELEARSLLGCDRCHEVGCLGPVIATRLFMEVMGE